MGQWPNILREAAAKPGSTMMEEYEQEKEDKKGARRTRTRRTRIA